MTDTFYKVPRQIWVTTPNVTNCGCGIEHMLEIRENPTTTAAVFYGRIMEPGEKKLMHHCQAAGLLYLKSV